MSLRKAAAHLRLSPIRWALVVVLVLTTSALLVAWRVVPPKRTFSVIDSQSAPTPHTTRARTVSEALAKVGVQVGPYDRVTPALKAELTPNIEIRIRRAVAVTVQADGKEQMIQTAADHVSDALEQLGVTLGQDDRVEPQPTALLSDGLAISVTRVRYEIVTEQTDIPFEEHRTEDRSLVIGESREVQVGQTGKKETTLRHTYENEQLTKTEVVAEKVVADPTTRVVAYGTMGAISRGGNQYRYHTEYTMRATAYAIGDGGTPGTHTAIGLPAKRGVVAVDPRVIPLGTRLYIEGYGYALAADTGGAIKGMKIDLCYDTVAEVEEFGVHTVHVYVLAD